MKSLCHILPASRAGRYFTNGALGLAVLATATPNTAYGAPPPAAPPLQEHSEFIAMLEADFAAPAVGEVRTFILHFTWPAARPAQRIGWRVALHRPGGGLQRQWRGSHALQDGERQVRLSWRPGVLPNGIYELRLTAGPASGERILQRRPIAIGPTPLLAPPQPLRAPAALPAAVPAPGTAPVGAPVAGALRAAARLAGLPYDIYYGNLHSQTGHSDGGGEPDACRGAQPPQSSPLGPTDAYAFARRHGLDFLLASEHNHMYDGSEGSAPEADPRTARQLYQIGRSAADDFNAAHPGFVALYGLEWGVINGGGHLNILNSPALLGWERDRNGELFADVATPKHDYAALYTLMKEQGWLGQFNHPGSAQFRINGRPLAYHPDGDAAMALCEVMNSNAFSTRLDEGEARHSSYESACNKLLEAGYHIAFSSNQDNHCANWGASYGNRTGILLAAGTAPTPGSLLEAIRARRVFATMDKDAAIVLTANGALMGSRIANQGPLTLKVHYAGRGLASLELMEGPPVRARPIANGMETTLTPTPGEHFYYIRATQDDGRQLWTAPIWVTQ